MQADKYPICGSDTDALRPCGDQSAVNGAAKAARCDPLPAELAGVAFERATPEMIEEARRTFDVEEYLAGVREIEAGRGVQINDLIAEMERKVHGSV